ncbi:hypothetical protein K488DRAFT_90200 [Vararia minispora EC-137]|uniref:Uncharacterized protein n=1 Tax=Vararia minispora EC-137 TaxID=1314806 RepID=A0ACB8Q8J5_9AGAM|nr:hypothetical protein K488DRAFT_90200 [Vararia minispora EC-137]
MDPTYLKKRIIDLSDAELTALGFMGENVPQGVKDIVAQVKADPNNLGTVTCFMVDCLKRRAEVQSRSQGTTQSTGSPASPTFPPSPTLSDAETLFSSTQRTYRFCHYSPENKGRQDISALHHRSKFGSPLPAVVRHESTSLMSSGSGSSTPIVFSPLNPNPVPSCLASRHEAKSHSHSPHTAPTRAPVPLPSTSLGSIQPFDIVRRPSPLSAGARHLGLSGYAQDPAMALFDVSERQTPSATGIDLPMRLPASDARLSFSRAGNSV